MRIFNLIVSFFCSVTLSLSQNASPEIKTIGEVIQGIDDLLSGVDEANEPQKYTDPSKTLLLPAKETLDRPFRLENELMPGNLQVQDEAPLVSPGPVQLAKPDQINLDPAPSLLTPSPQPSFSQGSNPDYSSASLDDLLREVESLELPEFVQPMVLPTAELATPLPAPTQPPAESTVAKDVILSPILQKDPQEFTPSLNVDDYTVLGESIDYEMKEKIREAIMATRMASGGSDNPFITRSVFKATSYCNRVLGRLNGTNHKRYRRDILLSLIGMHEKNQAWVDAAKSYERYLEEFAANDLYPFEDHEDAPGIPDLKAGLGSTVKYLEGLKRGAPTIPETHIRLGKIYRSLGAHRMALNKFYDAINATLTLPRNEAFELAARRKGQTFQSRLDAESNQAMFEIAETFMDSEDYDNAIKFFDRLWRLDQLQDSDRAVVRFKQGLAHYRRARESLREKDRIDRLPPEKRILEEANYEETPRADFAKVKEVLRGYQKLYPGSPYAPESHYLLALTYEQLNQDEESIRQLLALLKEADFNPEKSLPPEQARTIRDRDYAKLRKMQGIWNFWKKKTGNYLANKFFENAEYFNAYRIYTALKEIDPSPSWQVPVLYQIALCQEKLGNYVQATETYSSIEEYVTSVKEGREGLANSEYLNFVFGMAKWRREQLEDTRAIRQAVNRYGIYRLPEKKLEGLQ
jgi:tetratricopeptide (TPR) repeat protein